MNILKIDTSDSKKITVGLEIDGKTYCLSSKTQALKAQAVLPLIEKIIHKHKLNIVEVDKIYVNKGPGSYTGLKVGVAIANALSFSLGIPINDKKTGDIVIPEY